MEQKRKTQPSRIKTCGSTFKNPEKNKAWELIKKSGCSDLTVGDAKLSKQHCNFFLNNGNASSSDIEQLIEEVRKKVFLKTGIKLELEIKIVDSSREEEIINRLSLRSAGKINRDDIASIFRPIYEVSKKLQAKEK